MTALRHDIRQARDRIRAGQALLAHHPCRSSPGAHPSFERGALLDHDVLDRTGDLPRRGGDNHFTHAVARRGGASGLCAQLCLTFGEAVAFTVMLTAMTGENYGTVARWPAVHYRPDGAAARWLAGTPLRATAGKLSATELITESGMARWKVYEHRDLVEEFQAQVKTADTIPDALRDLTAENQRLAAELAATTAALRQERARTALVRRALAEASIELEDARRDPAATLTAFRRPATRRARQASVRQPLLR